MKKKLVDIKNYVHLVGGFMLSFFGTAALGISNHENFREKLNIKTIIVGFM
jgi:hypothetical protein